MEASPTEVSHLENIVTKANTIVKLRIPARWSPLFCFSRYWFHLCLSGFICGAVYLWLAPPASAKEKADLLVIGGAVITMDAQHRVIEDGAVAVRGDSIVAVGQTAELEPKFEAARTIDAHGAIVMPGLINGHAHAAMSLFRGIADDLSLEVWLHKYIFPAEARNVSEDFVAWGTRLGIMEMLRGGITTYADMYYFEDAVARVTKEAGMRGRSTTRKNTSIIGKAIR
jgi:5-methylthioadenosine/S-adenosylhomocysteine deaminase